MMHRSWFDTLGGDWPLLPRYVNCEIMFTVWPAIRKDGWCTLCWLDSWIDTFFRVCPVSLAVTPTTRLCLYAYRRDPWFKSQVWSSDNLSDNPDYLSRLMSRTVMQVRRCPATCGRCLCLKIAAVECHRRWASVKIKDDVVCLMR